MASSKSVFAFFIFLLCGVVSVSKAASQIGIIVIDVQKSFVTSAANENMPEVLTHTKLVFQLAEKKHTPFFITYEGSKSGDHDIPNDLKILLPRHQKDFVKTTFAATGLPSFVTAVKTSGLTHFIVLGAETDVCVMQTVLGMRALGFQVSLQTDAVFSSESNVGPALRRMAAAGVSFVDMAEVKSLIEGLTLPKPSQTISNSIIEPIKNGTANIALVINLLDERAISASTDRFKREKLERLRELLLVSEWFQIPTYLVRHESEKYQLPNSIGNIMSTQARNVLASKEWHSFASFPKDDRFAQVFVAGIDQNLERVTNNLGPRQIFVMEDALLASSSPQRRTPLVPLTYKSAYYGMTKSISQSEWPSQVWVERDSIFYPLTAEPEELAPIRLQ